MRKNYTGEVFKRLTAVERIPKWNGKQHTAYRCLCECGGEKVVLLQNLKNGHVGSCGCLRREMMREKATKHGLHGSPLYSVWSKIKNRCYDKNNEFYKDYGGRGIFVCKEWLNSPVDFIAWSIDNGYKKGLQIDREDNDNGYSPENCRFVTPKVNSRNKRNNVIYEYNGESKCIAEWAELYKLRYNTLFLRLNKYKWSIEKSLTTPVRKITRAGSMGA